MLCGVSVSPGYHDEKIRPWNRRHTTLRSNGRRYADMWHEAIKAGPDVISPSSFLPSTHPHPPSFLPPLLCRSSPSPHTMSGAKAHRLSRQGALTTYQRASPTRLQLPRQAKRAPPTIWTMATWARTATSRSPSRRPGSFSANTTPPLLCLQTSRRLAALVLAPQLDTPLC
jgi:hypothetical protein